MDGAIAREHGHPRAALDGRYIQVTLARPVPPGGQGRVRIDKTYVDPKSYSTDGRDIVFSRSLSIRRNSVVLPLGFELLRGAEVTRRGLDLGSPADPETEVVVVWFEPVAPGRTGAYASATRTLARTRCRCT